MGGGWSDTLERYQRKAESPEGQSAIQKHMEGMREAWVTKEPRWNGFVNISSDAPTSWLYTLFRKGKPVMTVDLKRNIEREEQLDLFKTYLYNIYIGLNGQYDDL